MVATPSCEHLLSARPVWVTGQAWAIPVGLRSGRSAHPRGPCVSRAVLSHVDGRLSGGVLPSWSPLLWGRGWDLGVMPGPALSPAPRFLQGLWAALNLVSF